ncbi:MAG: P-loop NTPase [Planctomycetota bacterium]
MTAARSVQGDQAARLRSMIVPGHPKAARRAERPHAPASRSPDRAPMIAIASGKGGVGKSLLSVSIAASLSRSRSALLVDADFGAANADVMLGIAPLRRLDECFQHRMAPGHTPAEIAVEVAERLWLVPGVIGSRFRPSDEERGALISALRRGADPASAMVVDTPAGVDRAVTDWLAAADCPIIVTTGEPTAMADAYALLKSLHAEHGPSAASRVRMIVNQAEASASGRRAAARCASRITAVADRFLRIRPAMLGVVPFDRKLRRGVQQQRPAALEPRVGTAGKAIDRIAAAAVKAAGGAQLLRSTGDVLQPGIADRRSFEPSPAAG